MTLPENTSGAGERPERRAASLFELLPLGIVVTGLDGKVTQANAAARRQLELPELNEGPWELSYRRFLRADGSPLAQGEHPTERAQAAGRVCAEPQLGFHGVSDVTWYDVVATPVAGTGVVTSYYDITVGRQVQEDLRHHIDQLDAFFDTNLDLLAILNSEGRAVRLNPAWGKLLDYDSDQLDGMVLLDFLHPSDTESTLGALARLRTPNEVVGFVSRLRRRDGTYPILEWRATARDDLVYVTARDITDQRMAEIALRESEARFRAIFEQAAAGVAEIDSKTGRFLQVNQRFCEIVGYSDAEMRSQTCYSITHPDDLPTVMCELRRLNEGGLHEIRREKRYLHQDGRTVWVDIQIKPLAELGSPPQRLVAVVDDITERRETDELLRQSLADVLAANQRLNFQILRMPLAYVAWDTDFVITEWNPAAERIFGWMADEAKGKHAYELLVPPEMRKSAKTLWQAVIDDNDPGSQFVSVNTTRDGRRITCEWFNAPLVDARGRVIGCLCMVHDISERLRVEERILHSQRLESLGSFAGGVAHDMTSLIRTIMALAQSVEMGPSDHSFVTKNMETILAACRRGRTLVRGLLDFARQDVADAQAVDLNAVLREQLALLAQMIPAKVLVEQELDSALPSIAGDPLALSSAVMHLLMNAVDAMPDGGVLTLRTRARGSDGIDLDIEDTGHGMTKEVLDHAIEPFFTTKRLGSGRGLGLPAAYGAIKAHHGWMDITSEPGRGTQVRIQLPLRPESAPAPQAEPLGSHPKGINILLVDDDDLVLTAVSAQLRRLGHSVTRAENGLDAIQKLEQDTTIDLVLLDMEMPVLGGRQTLPRLRAMRPHLPVIIETGNMSGEAEGLTQTFADVAVLVRPFSLGELKAALAPWVERLGRPPADVSSKRV